jgi:glycosyltransferase involved in cell wall biosynthesis
MRFSIVIPARNGALFLAETLECALSQTRRADEVVLIDDASTDATRRIVESEPFKGRIRYLYNAVPSGFADAWNRAAGHATGDFVTLLHQDDLLHPEYLAVVEQALGRFPGVKHVYSACDYIDADGIVVRSPAYSGAEPVLYSGKEYAHNYFTGVLRNDHIHRCPGVTTSRELLLRCGYRKEAGHIADDDFFLRVGAFTDVVGIARPLASFRIHDESVTGKLPLLSLRLAQDYVFQSRDQLANGTLLDLDDIRHLHAQTVRFINLALCQALNQGRDDWTRKAMSLRDEFEELVPGFMDDALPLWAKGLWLAAGATGQSLHARMYARAIAGSVALRDGLRRAFR